MKGVQNVINHLNKQLTLELTSMDQYLAHSKMYEDWGINKLHEKLAHEYEEELEHARRLTQRILFLEGTPDTASRQPIKVGDNVKQMLENDLEAERTVAASLREIIGICETSQDYVSREILEDLLDDTEMDHIYWLEQHLGLIDKVGLQNYIQSQMGSQDG
ncbi:bacterioferritin [Shewanella eurypsychrophilus]|uniref:Bacterioferritin n=1 Tax=Shewanella eurypsychrophilus TaxID=2593656 RepID=A0ABX6V8E1_9GAMM|nr:MULTISPECIES: bacterioferritin [Shewanella]QFU22819.1 bacterioferritin [Shewanella sp. YLB-09]QPG58106.1 bacterioferritin [Shewanella eurypsychrophilus]